MLSDKRLHSRVWGLIYLAAWLIPTVGLKLLFDDLLGSLILHVLYVMMLLPAWDLVVAFAYTRRHGLNIWLIAYMTAATLLLYALCGFNTLSPNFCIVNLICGFFGFGIGNIFKDEAYVAAQEDIDSTRKKKKMEAEHQYISLIDTDPNTGERANLRKRNRKKNEH